MRANIPNSPRQSNNKRADGRFVNRQIKRIEQAVLGAVKPKPEYEKPLAVPGIGKILALAIMLETGEISRFRKVGNYSSYCRCVKSSCTSNNKNKGGNNGKNGNRYLCWAYVEAANFIRRFCPEAKKLEHFGSSLNFQQLNALPKTVAKKMFKPYQQTPIYLLNI